MPGWEEIAVSPKSRGRALGGEVRTRRRFFCLDHASKSNSEGKPQGGVADSLTPLRKKGLLSKKPLPRPIGRGVTWGPKRKEGGVIGLRWAMRARGKNPVLIVRTATCA